ncbi:hypothetical protein T484DRAFT_1953306 [Baffinella frigidus]|nr:hypothetical protein T484DRAFT_1953306 [Cryptophyta sp. CCMP2293]
MQSMNTMFNTIRGASPRTKSAEKDKSTEDSLSSGQVMTPPRSPKSQAAIEKCMSAIEECRLVLAGGASCHRDDDLLHELALSKNGLQFSTTGVALPSGRLPREPLENSFEEDNDEPPPKVERPSSGKVKAALRDASWENASWEEQEQGGKPRLFRKARFFRWPKPLARMLLEVEARGC